ncbi:MAG: hypothetical protein RSG22_16495 [Comamonas sp.]
MSAASLIANHMNVPYGRIVSPSDVVESFRNGCLSASDATADAILAPFFNEIEPSLILRCAWEVDASLEMVNRLYAHTLSLGFMPSPEWETAVAHLLAGSAARSAPGN